VPGCDCAASGLAREPLQRFIPGVAHGGFTAARQLQAGHFEWKAESCGHAHHHRFVLPRRRTHAVVDMRDGQLQT